MSQVVSSCLPAQLNALPFLIRALGIPGDMWGTGLAGMRTQAQPGPLTTQVPRRVETCPACAADQQGRPPVKTCHHPAPSIPLREGRPLHGRV